MYCGQRSKGDTFISYTKELEESTLESALALANEDPIIFANLRKHLQEYRDGNKAAVAWFQVVGQKSNGHCDLGHALTSAHLLAYIKRGKLLASYFYVGAEPSPNNQTKTNNAKLSALHKPLLILRADKGDGYVWGVNSAVPVHEPTTRIKLTFAGAAAESQDGNLDLLTDLPARTLDRRKLVQRKTMFPLEVGTTSHIMTWQHIMNHRGVARWPYGSDCITLLHLAPSTPTAFGLMDEFWANLVR